ncbi:MerR family DNA-binding protein, partial [Enterococcus faecalis]|uniref:MerR family DNA-binding protein n=1 Tax=Enterococcus faecalis TaxID=1351 RepID=UPI003CC55677
AEVNRLQQILFYRELDLNLDEIKEFLEQPDFNVEQALYEHLQKLLEKRNEIDRLLASVEQTLHHYKGVLNLSVQQKFEG